MLIYIINLLYLLLSISCVTIFYSLFNYNPMYSLLFFILTLFNITLLLFLQNFEFISFLLGLIYFGAILILFFYIILLLNLQQVIRDNKHIKKIPINLILGFIIIGSFFYYLFQLGLFTIEPVDLLSHKQLITVETLSLTLFNDFSLYILIIGLILFITLIGLVLMLISTKSINLIFQGKVPK